jgi:hypothetical protein
MVRVKWMMLYIRLSGRRWRYVESRGMKKEVLEHGGCFRTSFCVCVCRRGGCLKQTNKPTAEVADPRTDLDDEKDEQVDQEA